MHNTCQVVDAIYEGVDAAVENGGEVKDVSQDWMDLGEKRPKASAPNCTPSYSLKTLAQLIQSPKIDRSEVGCTADTRLRH